MRFPWLSPSCALALLLTGCAPPSYRLMVRDAVPVLVPPGVNESVTRRKVKFPVGKCPAEWMDREELTKAAAGSLTGRIAGWQERGCVPAGGGSAWAESLLTKLALPAAVAYRLTHPPLVTAGSLDLREGYRLRMVSPIFREGAGASAVAVASTAATPGGLAVTARASADLLGYETAWFTVGARAIEPRGAEARVEGQVTKTAASRFGYLAFAPEWRLFRMLFLTRSSAADRDALVVAARTESELEAAAREINAEPARCAAAGYQGRCVVLPRQVALTAFVAVTVNGAEVLVAPGATVRTALREVTKDDAALLAARLRVTKLYRGRPVAVEHREGAGILELPLTGGESVSW